MRLPMLVLITASLAACGSQAPPASHDGKASAPARAPTTDAALAAAPVNPAPAPLPAAVEPVARVASGVVNYGCAVDSDCVVKNVGNCCGYFPACVNRDSPTFPDQVLADCVARGESSICGFVEIQACRCDGGHCAAADSAVQ